MRPGEGPWGPCGPRTERLLGLLAIRALTAALSSQGVGRGRAEGDSLAAQVALPTLHGASHRRQSGYITSTYFN